MWWHVGNGYGWGGMALGMVNMLLFWVLLVAAVMILVRYLSGKDIPSEHREGKTALEILKDRYARGEIEREEFEQKKRDLSE